MSPRWSVVRGDELDAADRAALRRLWDDAFGDRFSDHDADHADAGALGVHVLARAADDLPVAHACAVPRRLRVGEVWHDAAYVEAVAVASTWQHRGWGTTAMQLLADQISARWPFALLSTSRQRFYERLGWQRWQGRSLTLLADGREVEDGEHGGLMALPLASELDLTLDVTCEDRPGDAW